MLPWTTCGNSWNTPLCREFDINGTGGIITGSINRSDNELEGYSTGWADVAGEIDNNTRYTSAAQEYFK